MTTTTSATTTGAVPAPLAVWSAAPLNSDVAEALARIARSHGVVRVAAMPDVHLADEVCVGTVVATRDVVYPSAVGGDIGCGMAAVRLDAGREAVDRADVAARILAGFERVVPIMAHRGAQRLPEQCARPLSSPHLEREARTSAPRQLGSLGRGNHFLEVQVDDDDGAVWLTVHCGSRGLGPMIRDAHIARAVAAGTVSETGLAYLEAEGGDGARYLDDMGWALAFARTSRQVILAAASEVLHDVTGAQPSAEDACSIECEHNHVERRDGLWIHRKGAINAVTDSAGIIPGSMGTATYHVVGRGHADALWSSSHGAGRAMSRSEARRTIRVRDLERDVRGVWFDHRKKAALVDEAPAAYKDIGAVMRAQRELTRIVRKLRPLISYKGV